jgi:hypothetical protein
MLMTLQAYGEITYKSSSELYREYLFSKKKKKKNKQKLSATNLEMIILGQRYYHTVKIGCSHTF